MMTSPQVSWLFFKARPARDASRSDAGGATSISRLIRKERATQKNSQPAAARRVAFKMGRRRRCSSVTDRFRYAPSFPPVRLGPACRRPILNATTSPLYVRRYTGSIYAMRSRPGETMDWPKACLFQPPNTTHLQNRIEYLANNNPTRIKKSGVRGSNHLF